MKDYGNYLFCACRRCVFLRNPQKSKTMTLNLIARKNLFRLSERFFSLALWWERAGVMTLSRGFVIAWERCLDVRDKLR
jgi:hypothetical protein